MDKLREQIIRENYEIVCERIEAAKARSNVKGNDVTLLAATKTVPAEEILFAINELGLPAVGENKVQELLEKYPLIKKEGLHLHFIGYLQTNKVRQIIDKVEMIQSLDRESLAKEIDKRAAAINKIMPVLVEINIGRETEKGGVFPEEAESFIKELSGYKNISVKGLMTMAPARSTEEEYERYFSEVKELYEHIKSLEIEGVSMEVLSMGMSDSYEIAARCGANMVRVGKALFGNRIYT
jgi:pyridoxal phosphate enzyme (YggS family)